jgi:hypothetical protein
VRDIDTYDQSRVEQLLAILRVMTGLHSLTIWSGYLMVMAPLLDKKNAIDEHQELTSNKKHVNKKKHFRDLKQLIHTATRIYGR